MLLLSVVGFLSCFLSLKKRYALQFFSEELGKSFLPYADQFMSMLLTFAANGNARTKDVAIGAVGSIAVAIGPAFVKYLGPVIGMLRSFMTVTQDDLLEVRGRACEVAGCVASAVGRSVLGDPLLQEFSRYAFQGLAIESNNHQYALRSAIYGYFTNLASVLGADFQPLLQQLFPFLLATITSQEGMVDSSAGLRDVLMICYLVFCFFLLFSPFFSAPSGLESLVEAGDDESDADAVAGKPVNFGFRMPIIEEKKTAITLVGALGNALGQHMSTLVDQFLPELLELCDYPHQEIRQTAVKALPAMVHIVNETWPNPLGPKWERGKFSNVRPLVKNVNLLLKPVLDTMLSMVKEDRDSEAIACTLEALPKIFEELGPASLEAQIQGEKKKKNGKNGLLNSLFFSKTL